MKAYAGIGSRKTPPEILEVMTRLAARLEADGWVLRSGGAEGADEAFERGVTNPSAKQIYLPWDGFRGRRLGGSFMAAPRWADATVDVFHPAPGRLSQVARRLMARNACQVLGPDSPLLPAGKREPSSSLVVCWTTLDGNGAPNGGTGQAIRIANHYDIPVRNLFSKEHLDAALDFIGDR